MKVFRLLPVLAFPAILFAPSAAALAAPTAIADVSHAIVRDLGRAPASLHLTLAVTLNYRNQGLLDQLTDLQAEPGSPLYEQWLSSVQFNTSFAPAARDHARVVASLRHAGFVVTRAYSNRTVIDATATRDVVERYFHTEIHRVMQAGARGEHFSNVRPAVEPAALAGLIRSVGGLNNLTLVHTMHELAAGAQRRSAGGYAVIGPPLRGSDGGYGPLAFAQGYDEPVQHSAGGGGKTYDGTGRHSGVVIDADFLDSDLAGFLSFFSINRSGPATVRVKIDGGPPSGNGSGDSVEAALDVETIVGTTPGTALYVYEFPSFAQDSYITDAYNQVVSDNIVDQANSSFGGCETDQTADDKTWDAIAEQGAALGITFHASSGDSGSRECAPTGVSAPASGPHFEAIGGTNLQVDTSGNYISESGWGGSGGGVSVIFALPKFQKNVTNVITSGRNVPDVAFASTGATFYYNGRFQGPIGGTSLSSPIFGGLTTQLVQVKGKRLGRADLRIYKIFKKKGYGSGANALFHDVTTGSNGGFSAKTGYDQVTGIGSIDGWNLGAQKL